MPQLSAKIRWMNTTPSKMAGIHTTIVGSIDDFLALNSDWDALIERSERGCIFARWDWIRVWLEVFCAPDQPLAIICVWRGKSLIGIAPFWIQTIKKFGAPLRILRFLGTGEEEADEVLPEYLDVFCQDRDKNDVGPAVSSAIRDSLGWDIASFAHVLPGSVIESMLSNEPDVLRPPTSTAIGARYRLQWEAGGLPSMPAAVAYKRRKLERTGKVAYQCVQDSAHLESAVEVLADLHAHRWESRGASGVFASKRFSRFHRRLAEVWGPEHRVRLHILRVDGTPVSALYNFEWRGTEYFYQGGLNTQLKGQSPGIVSHAYAIENAAKNGATAYDFLGGELPSYKAVFGAQPEPLATWTFENRTWRGRLARMLIRKN